MHIVHGHACRQSTFIKKKIEGEGLKKLITSLAGDPHSVPAPMSSVTPAPGNLILHLVEHLLSLAHIYTEKYTHTQFKNKYIF